MDRGELKREATPRNPLYLLLLVAGLVFVLTALAYALIPELERKAIEAGNPPPSSPLRDALRADGWKWLLVEVAVVVALAVLSMVWDHRQNLRQERGVGAIANEHRPECLPPGEEAG